MGLSMGMLDASLAVLSCAATQAHWKVREMTDSFLAWLDAAEKSPAEHIYLGMSNPKGAIYALLSLHFCNCRHWLVLKFSPFWCSLAGSSNAVRNSRQKPFGDLA